MIFDEHELLRYTEEDTELSSELLQMAVTDIPDFLIRAILERAEEKYSGSAEYLHKIKGIAGCVGAMNIHSLSAQMEQDIKSVKNGSFFDLHIEDLKDAVSCFFGDPSVQKYLKQPDVS